MAKDNPQSFLDRISDQFLLVTAVSLLVLVLGSYAIAHILAGSSFTVDNGTWGSFGDYVGGILNPILSFIVIIILLKDLKLTRDELRKSTEAQTRSSVSAARMIEIQTPRPRLSYQIYASQDGNKVFLVFENIGTSTARIITCSFMTTDMSKIIAEPITYSTMVPGQKLAVNANQVFGGRRLDLPKPHCAVLQYSSTERGPLDAGGWISEQFVIDQNMINSTIRTSTL